MTTLCHCCVQPDCCPGFPTSGTLHASIDGAAGCACATGAPSSCLLTYNGVTGKWEGTMAMGTCGMNITVAFYFVPPNLTVADSRLDTTWSDGCRGPFLGALPAPASSCDPCSVHFAVDVDVACGCTVPGAEFGVLITP